MTTLFALLLAASLPRATSTRTQPKTKPPIVLEAAVKRTAAVDFNFRAFNKTAADRCQPPCRVEFRLLDGKKATVSFSKPETDAHGVTWSGRIDGTKVGTGTIVLYDQVVSGSLRFDDGRVFDFVTAGKDVWMREIDTAVLDREAR